MMADDKVVRDVLIGKNAPSLKQAVIEDLRNDLPMIEDIHPMELDVCVIDSPLSVNEQLHVDSGVYMLHIMETYKGMKKFYKLDLHNDREGKIFNMRICHRILTWNENTVKEKVEKEATSGFSALLAESPSYSDDDLVKFMSSGGEDIIDVTVVETEWRSATRVDLSSLFPGQLITDGLIDIYGVKLTYYRNDVLYIPTIINVNAEIKNEVAIWGITIPPSYIPINADTIKKVFVPIHHKVGEDEHHWVAVIIDMDEEFCYILDSTAGKLTTKPMKNRKNHTELVVKFLAQGFALLPGYEKLEIIYQFEMKHVKIPQQKNE